MKNSRYYFDEIDDDATLAELDTLNKELRQ